MLGKGVNWKKILRHSQIPESKVRITARKVKKVANVVDFQLIPRKGIHPFYIGMEFKPLTGALTGWVFQESRMRDEVLEVTVSPISDPEKSILLSFDYEYTDGYLCGIDSDFAVSSSNENLCGISILEFTNLTNYNVELSILGDKKLSKELMEEEGYGTFENDDLCLRIYTDNFSIFSISVWCFDFIENNIEKN